MTVPGRIFSVSEITSEIKEMLESRFDLIWIAGEISDFSAPASGHLYFTLKDERARIRCVMFRGQNRALRFRPENGMEVTGMGRVGLYEPRGTYQVIFEFLEPQGLGALQKAFEQLKATLEAEGLFDTARKKPIPFLPTRIALVTSPTGAAVQDFLKIACRRFEQIAVDVVPVNVQGALAAKQIAAAIELLDGWQRFDVIVLARGGGSLEDLQAFNSEAVARAIDQARIPVVSAVGHETDFTIADFVSDLRAPTPSAAAEMLMPRRSELVQSIAGCRRRMARCLSQKVDTLRLSLHRASRRLAHPRRRIDDLHLRIDDLYGRLVRAFGQDRERRSERLGWVAGRLRTAGLEKSVSNFKQKNNVIENKIQYLFKKLLSEKRSSLQGFDAQLAALNPMAVLQRGYSITRTVPGGRIVMDPETVRPGQPLRLTLARGDLNVVSKDPIACKTAGKQEGIPDHGKQQTDL
jgi:exodeoxyribonuclease VII large subunit